MSFCRPEIRLISTLVGRCNSRMPTHMRRRMEFCTWKHRRRMLTMSRIFLSRLRSRFQKIRPSPRGTPSQSRHRRRRRRGTAANSRRENSVMDSWEDVESFQMWAVGRDLYIQIGLWPNACIKEKIGRVVIGGWTAYPRVYIICIPPSTGYNMARITPTVVEISLTSTSSYFIYYYLRLLIYDEYIHSTL